MPDSELAAAHAQVSRVIRVYSICSTGDFTIELFNISANLGGSSSVEISIDNTKLTGAGSTGPAVSLMVSGSEEIETMARGFAALAQELHNIA